MRYLALWIKDCSKEDLVNHLQTKCSLTNETVQEENEACPCVAHTLFGAKRVRGLLAESRERNSRFQADSVKHLQEAQKAASDLAASAKLRDLATKEAEAFKETSGRLGAELEQVTKERQDYKQLLSNARAEVDNLKPAAVAAQDKLKSIQATLKTLL